MQLYTKILVGMAIGVGAGFTLGPNSALLTPTAVELAPNASIRTAPDPEAPAEPLAVGRRRAALVEAPKDDTRFAKVRFRLGSADLLRIEKARGKDGLPKAGTEVGGFVDLRSPGVRPIAGFGQLLVDWTEWIGRLFLALIKMVVVPLVFFSLTVGVASLGDFRRLGRMGGRTLGLFTGTTILSLTIGVSLANLIGPGRFLTGEDRAGLLASYEGEASSTVQSAADAPSFVDQIIGIVPTNPAHSLAEGNMLQIIFFAVMFGIALTLIPNERSTPVAKLLDDANEAMVMLVHIAMKLAPVGVAALLFKVVGTTGISVLYALGVYGLVVIAGLLLHLTLTYGSIVRFGARLSFLGFLKAIRPALLLAFSTSSSSATLPVTKESVEDGINVSNEVSSFVLPLGATVNMDGTALYQGVAALFIAQIYGMDLGIFEQLTIITSATLASVGAAGVPGAGMITLAMVLTTVGVPTEGLALVLGVDRLLDMFRTATNVVGDASATVWVARLEGDDLRLLSSAEDRASTERGFEGRLEDGPHPVSPE